MKNIFGILIAICINASLIADNQIPVSNKQSILTEKTIETLEKECNKKDNYEACLTLGDAYFTGKNGVKTDYDKAAFFLVSACRTGRNNSACLLLGSLYEQGKGVAKDIYTAQVIYEESCNIRHYKPACKRLKELPSLTIVPTLTVVETQGNLKARNRLTCININSVKPTYTPVDLLVGLQDCITKENYQNAAKLYLMAKIHGHYDKLRVKDTTAHQAIAMIQLQVAQQLSKEQIGKFEKAYKKLIANKQIFCSNKFKHPNYYPRYMLKHGIRAVNGVETGLVKDFNEEKTWADMRNTYLKCPK